MTKKVILNTYVDPQIHHYVKVTAAQEGKTMVALFEQIIVEWQKSHLINKSCS